MRPPVYIPPPRRASLARCAVNGAIMALGAIMGALVLIGYFGG